MHSRNPRDSLPDVRDGLTHRERIVYQCLHTLQRERGGRNVPTGMLYGTVVEHVDALVLSAHRGVPYDQKSMGEVTGWMPNCMHNSTR